MEDFSNDLAVINGIAAVPTILDVICRTTGMGFAAVARVTEGRWIACSVLDHIQFGLEVGGELDVETTICHQIRKVQEPVVIDHVAKDALYQNHGTPKMYGFQSYISMPIFLKSGQFFGTLCAIDPMPAVINTPGVIGMFKMFAELIGFHIDDASRLAESEAKLSEERADSELREQFIAVLGHDLRNPLVAISMGTSMLKISPIDERSGLVVNMMEKSVERMSDLIDDVMDFARGRLAGGINIKKSEAPLEPVLIQVIEELRAGWPSRVIDCRIQIGEEVSYDHKRLAQLFTNLLGNALTHGTPDEPVRVEAITGDGKFQLSVANAATPIPPRKLEQLFEPFSRGGSENESEGLGLGLYIASQIAKSHGGTLVAISNEKETRFTFTMPAEG